MILLQKATDWDRENRPKNYSALLNDDEWYSMCNELGELNERNSESWGIAEILKMVQEISMSGDFQFATTHEFQVVFNNIDYEKDNITRFNRDFAEEMRA